MTLPSDMKYPVSEIKTAVLSGELSPAAAVRYCEYWIENLNEVDSGNQQLEQELCRMEGNENATYGCEKKNLIAFRRNMLEKRQLLIEGNVNRAFLRGELVSLINEIKIAFDTNASMACSPSPETLGPQPKDQPLYIQNMIEQGRLYPDGKRVTKSLSDILDYLVTVMDPIPARFILETFRKPSGKLYAMKTIQRELETINSGKTPGKVYLLSPQKKSV